MSKIKIFDIDKGTRAKAPVTLFKGCLGSPEAQGAATLGEILKLIEKGNKQLDPFSEALRDVADKDPVNYKKAKEKECPAFIPGVFSKRLNDDCQEYVPLMGFDIDHTGTLPGVVANIKRLSGDPYVYAAFASPSGQGVRFFVWAASTPENHKEYYQAICEHYSQVLEIPTDKALLKSWEELPRAERLARLKKTEHIDTGTNNLARLWFYTSVPGDCFYQDPESQVFYHKLPGKQVQPSRSGGVTEDDKVKVCLEKVQRQSLPAGRNNFVFALASELARHGVSKGRALQECSSYEQEDFKKPEIKKTVESAYKSKKQEFTDKQIKKYKQMTGGGARPSTGERAPEPPKDKEEDLANKPKFIQMRARVARWYDFRFNEVSLEIEYAKKGTGQYEKLNENDVLCELMEVGFSQIQAPFITLMRSKFVPPYDPFQEYFTSLPEWKEGDPDYINQLADFVEAKDQYWFNQQFKKMLVRSVACALKVIPFNKQCFVLKGNQNDGKTSFIRFLCPPQLDRYITEHIDINNKDGRVALCNNYIINLEELSQFNKKDIAKVKGFITTHFVKERLPYDRTFTSIRRRASFFGSTNDDEFLVDETGNVRWLVFEVRNIRHDKGGPQGYNQQIDITKVYAQAYALLKSGFQFQLTKEELAKSEKNNKSFQVITIEQELIQEHFAPATEGEAGAEFVTATEVLQTIEKETKTTTSTRNVGRAMKLLGFQKTQKFFKEYGHQKKGYWAKRIITS